MESLAFGDLPEGALLLIDSAPIIYVLEDHPKFVQLSIAQTLADAIRLALMVTEA